MLHSYGKVSTIARALAVLAIGVSTASAQTTNPIGLKSSAFSASTTAAAAASNSQEGFGIQIVVGPVFANLDDAGSFSTSAKTGWLVGLGLGGNRGGRVGVEADILYGMKKTGVGTGEFEQHVIDVPVMLKGNIGSTSRSGASVFVQGGGFFDWQFDYKTTIPNVTDDTTGFEAGLVFGGGVEYMRISVQGRYYRGLRAIDRKFNLATSAATKTEAFAILFAIRAN